MTADQAKFQLEFMAMMLQCGRDDEAQQAFYKVLDYLTELTQETTND